ncbi:hypothetical protein J2X68_000700 [Streptomyces sp. 3330]|uniref:hypothetical protein n=1 Tax=Streptomyces sp. 3330 TaxID=2817755 RepID=UPI00285A0FD0|nr:hypothetical protein [Streptomyces sp. 3330]MDR6974022.1 hypothetical protein [Streptomyces sp. 3330]
MDLHDVLPPAVPAKEPLALAEDHHACTARPLGVREIAGRPVGAYAREAPGRAGPAPCVAEAAVPARERDAVVRHVLDGSGPLGERPAGRGADTVDGDVR